jgi:hypothetical protein
LMQTHCVRSGPKKLPMKLKIFRQISPRLLKTGRSTRKGRSHVAQHKRSRLKKRKASMSIWWKEVAISVIPASFDNTHDRSILKERSMPHAMPFRSRSTNLYEYVLLGRARTYVIKLPLTFSRFGVLAFYSNQRQAQDKCHTARGPTTAGSLSRAL